MNYRHAFHAGNFADCMKHAVLVWLLRALRRKDTPFAVLDTHAGIGRYDLDQGPAERTGEWRDGIGKLLQTPPAELADYLGLVASLGLYPGSPALARALLRPGDRLICCELHPQDHAALRTSFARDRQVSVHLRDGYEALAALLPPHQRRGLVLIDPPYENPDEFAAIVDALRTGRTRFRAGVFVAWYPIKHRAPVRDFHAAVIAAAIPDAVCLELCLREPLDPARLNGCGLLIANPPFGLETEALPILHALLDRLGSNEPGAGVAIRRLTRE